MRTVSAALALAILAAAPAHAEVAAQSDNGFAVRHVVSVTADPDTAFAMLRTPAKWWDKAHTWTGSADNLYMDAQAGGCFCELIPNEATTESGVAQRTLRGSVQHMQIVYVDPGKMLRLSGALGPLQGEAMAGTLTISLVPIKGGTKLTFEYVAGGFMRMAMADVAPAVDGVMGAQASRFAMAMGPLVGGAKAELADEPAQPEETVEEPAAPAGRGSLSDLLTDLEPDAEVSGASEAGPDGAPETMAADETMAATEAASDEIDSPPPAAAKPRAKPVTGTSTTRPAKTGSPAASDPETGR